VTKRGNRFRWTYYPPNEFKVLIYFPENDAFLASEIHERYAFDSYFIATISGVNLDIAMTQSYQYSAEIASLAIRIVLTIAIELAIALIFCFIRMGTFHERGNTRPHPHRKCRHADCAESCA